MVILGRTIRGRRGAVVAIALFLGLLASVSTLLMSNTLLDHQRLNTRRRDLWRSFLIAEAGIDQVKHWGLMPEDYTPDTNLFRMASATGTGSETPGLVNVETDPEDIFPDLATALSSGPIEFTAEDLAGLGIGSFQTTVGTTLGHIERLRLIPADASDPVACFFKIESTGESNSGLQRVVLAYMDLNPLVGIAVPAGLISLTSGSMDGNARIHWGEAWSKTNFNMPPRSQMTYLQDDPLAIYRTESNFDFSNGWRTGVDLFDPAADQPGLFPDGSGPYANTFHQNVPEGELNWPDFISHYDTFKELALANGRYYSTDSAGNIYRDGIEDAAHQVDFLEEFGVADRSRAPHDLVFIDTVDGNPPAADGSNLSTVGISGNSLGLKGVFYINAHVDSSGVGDPGSVTVENPDGASQTLEKVLIDGVFYTSGMMEFSGNTGVFGSVIAQQGFTGTGTPDVYYNQELADGMPIDNGMLGSPFRVVMRTNFGTHVDG